MSARRGGGCICRTKYLSLLHEKAVPILCVQRFSSVQRNIGFLVIYDIVKAEFPTSSVGATLVREQANGIQLPALACSLPHMEPRQGKQAGYGYLTDLAFSAFTLTPDFLVHSNPPAPYFLFLYRLL